MKKTGWMKLVNLVLALAFLFQASTGAGHDIIDEELFENIHYIGGIILVTVAAFHLWLNWGWVKGTYFTRSRAKGERI